MDVAGKLQLLPVLWGGCPAVQQENKCAPVENKWGGLVVSECQLLQSLLGLIPAPELFVLLLAPTSPARLSPGEAAHALQCLQAWGGCRELGDIKNSFILKSSASTKSFGSG